MKYQNPQLVNIPISPLRFLLLGCACIAIGMLCSKAIYGEWRTYSPPGSVNGKGILLDVTSRTHDPQLDKFRNDKATWTHEGTHLINADIANRLGGPRRKALYVGGGHAMILSEPHISFEQLDQHETNYRNDTYQLYFKQARHNDDRLDFLDEWTAYTNDVQCTKEWSLPSDGGDDRASWFCFYADGLVSTVKDCDPSYPEMKDLTSFVDWQKARVGRLLGNYKPPARDLLPTQILGEVKHFDTGINSCLIDLDPKYRQHNDSGSDCVHCSIVNLLRINGEWKAADEFWRRYGHTGADTSEGLAPKLNSMGIRYQQTMRADKQFVVDAITSGRGVAVGVHGQHMLNVVGCDDQNVVLMGNMNGVGQNKTEPWSEFLAEFDGWAVVILSGSPPKAVTQ